MPETAASILRPAFAQTKKKLHFGVGPLLPNPEDTKKAGVTPKELDMAKRLIDDMSDNWDPAKYHDTFREDIMALVNKKVKAALKHGIVPILCVGEKLDVREAGGHIEHTADQLIAGLKGLKAEQVRTVVVAYEPVWAIGTGRVATPADAEEVCAALRAVLAGKYGAEVAADVRVLYGGSAKANNVSELVACDNVDGALVGGASLDGDEFTKLCALAAGGPLP